MLKSLCLNLLLLCATSTALFSQTNVRAWYAQGQVWVLWQTQLPYPETYAIYKSNQAFTNTSQATAIGRPFFYEYLPGAFVVQTGNDAFRYKIPKPDGSIYKLAENEALFVETVGATGSAYYAVVEWGSATATPGVNRTQNPVAYTYDPVNDPVNCHLQFSGNLPSEHKSNWYCLWAYGRQEHWAGRPDFPVMANAFKNGMPGMFIVSEAIGMDTTGGKRIPATNWFHGGGGTALQHAADKWSHVNIAPQTGISISHNDDFPQKLIYDGDTTFSSSRSLWFGWTKAHNPFNPNFSAAPGDTVINYTQRKILWINNWLIKHYRVDPDRIALQGYSMGSGGASALGKAYPNFFSTVCAFNNGYRGGAEPTSENIVGSAAENLPTNLRRANNEVVHINEVFDLTTPISPARDLPLFRIWAGKTDNNDRMHWGSDLVSQYRKADSLGLGAQISWDERPHTYETLGYHWINDKPAPEEQTFRDNLAFQENFNSKQSYPAFFNHRLDAQNNNPGTGVFGINTGDGDNWGTWGGYHNWDPAGIVDEAKTWEVTAWLTANAVFDNDNCPHNALTADLAIRKPQQFLPAAGKTLNWTVQDETNGQVLQSGVTTVHNDGLVALPQVLVFVENVRRVRIRVSDPSVAASEPENTFPSAKIQPNPSGRVAFLSLTAPKAGEAEVSVCPINGATKRTMRVMLAPGQNKLALDAFENLPSGLYVLVVRTENQQNAVEWIKMW